ncbi:hypothetical protein N7G274_007535 [Stereocaulon virgatum]|uniref:Uncharacterized protein n=1 Tax=Stereocaulon virgatum TaxID=373712 RepID=A0ABR4A3Z2_9LECA
MSSIELHQRPGVNRIEPPLLDVFAKSSASSNLIALTDFTNLAGRGHSNPDSNASITALRPAHVQTVPITTLANLSSRLANTQNHAPLRIISCCSQNSVRPLRMTREMFECILRMCEIDVVVMETMACLGTRARKSEVGMGNVISRKRRDSKAFVPL